MKTLYAAVVLILVLGTASAQEPRTPGQTAGKTNDNAQRDMFTDDPMFDIYFFGQTPSKNVTPVDTDLGKVNMTSYMYERGSSSVYMVAVSTYPEGGLDGSDPQVLLDNAKGGFVKQLGVDAENERNISIDGHPGIYFTGQGQGYYTAMVDYLIGNSLIQVGIMRSDRMPTKSEIDEFIFSFRLKSGKNYNYFEEDPAFRINFNGEHPSKEVSPVETAIGTINMTTYMVEDGSSIVYMVAISDYPEEYMGLATDDDLLKSVKEGYVGNMNLNVTTEKQVSHKGNNGIYFEASGGGYYTEVADYLVENRLYQIAILRTDRASTQKEIQDFIFSFELK